jgi:mono/diheme cytochrome c family protein
MVLTGFIGCTFSLARPTQAQTVDQPVTVKVASSNPFSGDPQAIASGRDLYFKWCAQCHGKKADGVSPRWGKYAKDLRKFWQGYSKFVLIVVQGVKGKQMPPWGEVLSGNQISQIGAYLETLAVEGANWQ